MKLQKELAKRQEKLDFMEEHMSTLTGEMKKKSKLLQSLMLKQDAGVLASSDSDDNKVKNLRYISLILSNKNALFRLTKSMP